MANILQQPATSPNANVINGQSIPTYNLDFSALGDQFGTNLSGQKTGAAISRLIALQLLPLLMQRLGMAGQLDSQLAGIVNRLGPGTRQAVNEEYARGARGSAAETGRQAALALEGAGFGSGMAGGAIMDAFGRGEDAIRQHERHWNDPEFAMGLSNLSANLANAFTGPALQAANSNPPPKQPKGPDPFMQLAGAAIAGAL